MNTTAKRNNREGKQKLRSFILLVFCILSVTSTYGSEELTNYKTQDSIQLNKYIQAKGSNIIVFDASNIKQYWIDNSVVSQKEKDSFSILLQSRNNSFFESKPLRIQLINVDETKKCNVEVITETPDTSFSILSPSSKTISDSEIGNPFINYNTASSSFNLEDVDNMTFLLKFKSKINQTITINKIILSFARNQDSFFLGTPGVLRPKKETIRLDRATWEPGNDLVISSSGRTFVVHSLKKILLLDQPIASFGTIKNVGEIKTRFSIGYAPYTKDNKLINYKVNPYKNINKVFTILSVDANKVIIDTYPEWEKGCVLALDAKEDLTDFPNFNFAPGEITEVKKIEDNKAEIVLSKPLQKTIKGQTKARIQASNGNTFIFVASKDLLPGEEFSFSSDSLKKDNLFYQFSPKAFCKGTYYIVPVILFVSSDPTKKSMIQIKDYSISY